MSSLVRVLAQAVRLGHLTPAEALAKVVTRSDRAELRRALATLR